jgi:hypothetical protein
MDWSFCKNLGLNNQARLRIVDSSLPTVSFKNFVKGIHKTHMDTTKTKNGNVLCL